MIKCEYCHGPNLQTYKDSGYNHCPMCGRDLNSPLDEKVTIAKLDDITDGLGLFFVMSSMLYLQLTR